MKNSIIKLGIVCMLALCACSGGKKAADNATPINFVSPPADRAAVYILRPALVGKLLNFKVEMDGQLVGKTKGKQYFYFFVEPGNHTLVSIAENKSELPIVMEAGKTYFFEQEVKMGIVKARNNLVRIDEVDAKIKVQKCKLPKDFVAP